MNKLLLSVVFSALIAVAFGALAQYPPAPPGHEGHCFSDDTGPISKAGEDIDLPGKCSRASCNGDGSITVATCGTILARHISKMDLTKPYPDCCPQPLP